MYQLENANGVSMRFMNYGAAVIAIEIPDFRGKMDNIILSLPTLQDYTKAKTYLGATIGRVAGRIRGGEWTFPLEKNEGENHCMVVQSDLNLVSGTASHSKKKRVLVFVLRIIALLLKMAILGI